MPAFQCGGIISLAGIMPGPPAGIEGAAAAGFDGVPPVMTSEVELNPRLLEVLPEDEKPPEEVEEEIPDDIENAATHQTVIRIKHPMTMAT